MSMQAISTVLATHYDPARKPGIDLLLPFVGLYDIVTELRPPEVRAILQIRRRSRLFIRRLWWFLRGRILHHLRGGCRVPVLLARPGSTTQLLK